MSKRNYIPVEASIPVSEGRYHLVDLEVSAHYNKADDFDFKYIKWNGMDLFPMLKNQGEAGQPMIDMCKAALRNNLESLMPFALFQMDTYGDVVDENCEGDLFVERLSAWADAAVETGEVEHA